jgi:hypothetical protein
MGGTTAGGLPYATGTDKARDGDNAIQALAVAIDAKKPWSAVNGNRPIGTIATMGTWDPAKPVKIAGGYGIVNTDANGLAPNLSLLPTGGATCICSVSVTPMNQGTGEITDWYPLIRVDTSVGAGLSTGPKLQARKVVDGAAYPSIRIGYLWTMLYQS